MIRLALILPALIFGFTHLGAVKAQFEFQKDSIPGSVQVVSRSFQDSPMASGRPSAIRKLSLKEKIGLWLLKKRLFKKNAYASIDGEDKPTMDFMALTGASFGLIGLISFVAFITLFSPMTFVFSLIFGLLAIIFSSISLGKIKLANGSLRGKGWAILGLILGFISTGMVILIIASFGA